MTITRKRESQYLQYVAATISCITMIGYGSSMTWTSPAIPHLTSENSPFLVSKEQSDRISSLLTVGFIIGYILNPFMIEIFGSKRSLLIYSVPQIISWVLIIIAKTHITIYVSRILAGIGYGGAICALTIYLSEISTPKIRGIFITLINLSLSLGFFFTMLLGASLSYNYMNLLLLSTPIIFLATFFFVPDSSHFLEKMSREEMEMKTRLNPLLGEDEDREQSGFGGKVDSKLNGDEGLKVKSQKDINLKDKSSKDKSVKEDEGSSKFFDVKESRLWKLLSLSNNRKALFILISISVADVFSGHIVLLTFTQQLLTYRGFLINPEKATLVLVAVRIIGCGIATQIIEKMGRRVLLLSFGILGTIAQGLVATYFFLDERNFDLSSFGWWPLLAISIYEISFTIGPINLFYLYQAELFSTEVRSVAVMVCKVSYMVFAYFCLFRFQVILAHVGRWMIYFFFSVCGGIGTLFIFSITSETRGKSIEEIQVIMKSKKFFV